MLWWLRATFGKHWETTQVQPGPGWEPCFVRNYRGPVNWAVYYGCTIMYTASKCWWKPVTMLWLVSIASYVYMVASCLDLFILHTISIPIPSIHACCQICDAWHHEHRAILSPSVISLHWPRHFIPLLPGITLNIPTCSCEIETSGFKFFNLAEGGKTGKET